MNTEASVSPEAAVTVEGTKFIDDVGKERVVTPMFDCFFMDMEPSEALALRAVEALKDKGPGDAVALGDGLFCMWDWGRHRFIYRLEGGSRAA